MRESLNRSQIRHWEADEPAFLAEWEEADLAGDVIGMTCLGMLQATFQLFLREYLKEVGREALLQVEPSDARKEMAHDSAGRIEGLCGRISRPP